MLLAIYTVLVLVVTLSPQMPGSGFTDRLVTRVLYELHKRGLFMSLDYLDIEFLGNILMFVPLGVFTALLIPRRAWWSLLLLGTMFSGFIEASQALFLPDRFPEWRDLLSNTLGFLLGGAASVSLRLLVAHRDRLVEADRWQAIRSQ